MHPLTGRLGLTVPLTVLALSCSSAPPSSVEPAPVRRHVTPGDVVWHADFDSARRAAAESGRPVMLFELFGHLDEALC